LSHKHFAQRQTAFRSSGIGSAGVDLNFKVNKMFICFIAVHQPLLWKANVVGSSVGTV
jgi:hypothetical protein